MKKNGKTVAPAPMNTKKTGNDIKSPPAKEPPFHDLPADPTRPAHG